ncbi:MAG: class I SAM-dependent methyltransferase [bacterium]|nr:class I SAM-dependent methyltransferase [bacterium]
MKERMLPTEEIKNSYPLFYQTSAYLQEKAFFYRDVFDHPFDFEFAEKMCADAYRISRSDWGEYKKKLDDLLRLSLEFLTLQTELEKNGRYRYSTFAEVEREVFKKDREGGRGGVDYLWGLYFTEVFWATHHRLFQFYRREFVNKCGEVGTCLDIPVGTGIFLSHFLTTNSEWKGIGIDLSSQAITAARELFLVNGQSERVSLVKEDVYEYAFAGQFERIICVEFLEHVEDPLRVLAKLNDMLKMNGRIFLATVAWAAAIDHIYLYKSADEVRYHIARSGFDIEQEYVQNIFPKDAGRLSAHKTALNFAAILKKRSLP